MSAMQVQTSQNDSLSLQKMANDCKCSTVISFTCMYTYTANAQITRVVEICRCGWLMLMIHIVDEWIALHAADPSQLGHMVLVVVAR